MPDRDHKYVFWLDLETTGSDLEIDGNRVEIIEVGAAITDMQLNVLEGRDYVIHLDAVPEWISDVVREMHKKNYLWAAATEGGWTIEAVDKEIAEWIRKFNGSDHMAFAGSGVSHFDRKFIRRDMPLLDKRITHWAMDVGSERRVMKYLAGLNQWPEDTKSHRAIDDVYFHIEEMKFAVDIIKRGIASLTNDQG